jgi:hypothetical protein
MTKKIVLPFIFQLCVYRKFAQVKVVNLLTETW